MRENPIQMGRIPASERAARRHTPAAVRAALVLSIALGLAGALPAASPADSASAEKGKPFVVTGRVADVRGTSVVLDGSVDPHGLLTTYYFVYGPTEGYGYQTPPQTLEAKNERVKVGVAITDFPAGYHYRLVAVNSAGPKLGRDRRFSSAPTLRFELSKTRSPIPYAHGCTVKGKLVGQGNEHVEVALQETPYPYLEAFANVGPAIETGEGGTFSFRVAKLSESAKLRVVAREPRPIYSAIVTQLVTPRVVLNVARTKVAGLVRLYGTITPAEAGARVLIQLDEPVRPGNSEKLSERTSRFATVFSTISRRGTRSMSRFSLIVTITRAGSYRAYADLHRGKLAPAGSETVRLKAAGSKKHR